MDFFSTINFVSVFMGMGLKKKEEEEEDMVVAD